eukprot:3086019-Rhodomonas_salina.3
MKGARAIATVIRSRRHGRPTSTHAVGLPPEPTASQRRELRVSSRWMRPSNGAVSARNQGGSERALDSRGVGRSFSPLTPGQANVRSGWQSGAGRRFGGKWQRVDSEAGSRLGGECPLLPALLGVGACAGRYACMGGAWEGRMASSCRAGPRSPSCVAHAGAEEELELFVENVRPNASVWRRRWRIDLRAQRFCKILASLNVPVSCCCILTSSA